MPTRVSLVLLFVVAGAARSAEPAKIEITAEKDIRYRTDDKADKERHVLDVYAPKGKKDLPVLFLVHGGSWQKYSKDYLGDAAKRFAEDGLCVVCPNYRLTPKVMHPEHVKDVAAAFAWTVSAVAKHGGDPKKIVVGGHSAGGHLASLLATDETYLKAEKRSLADVRGIVGVAGVYVISDYELFHPIFGKDPAGLAAASPATHAGAKTPPAFLLYADKDLPRLDLSAKTFAGSLTKAKREVTVKEYAGRDHNTILLKMADKDDPAGTAVAEFVRKVTAK